MKDDKNVKWTMDDIAHQYKLENESWTWSQCWGKAKEVYRELNRMNNELWKGTKVFFDQTTPFSFFDNKDDEFSNIFRE